MFSSINFLFLTSLAFTSWIILLYFKQIEQQRVEEIYERFTMERTLEEALTPCREDYDIYLNFLCIFACIYALAKITHLTEGYISRQVRSKFGHGGGRGQADQQSIDDYRRQQQQMAKEIHFLQKTNSHLQQRLQQLQHESNIFLRRRQLSNDVEDLDVDCDNHTISSSNSNNSNSNNNNNNNIYISNRHFHLNRQVFLNEGNVKLDFPDIKEENGDFLQIWSKYLEMQKFAIKTPTPNGASTEAAGFGNPMPVVVSTEELQTLQGLF